MKKLSVLFVILFTFSAYAQKKSDQETFRAEQDSIYGILFTNTKKAKQRLDQLFEKSDSMADSTKALNYRLLGIYLNLTGELDSSIVVFKKGLEINGDYEYRKPKFLSNIGTAQRNSGRYNQALSTFKELEQYYLDKGDTLEYAGILGELASIYNVTLQSERAVEHLTKAIEIYEEKGGDIGSHGVLIQRLANTYMKQEKFNFALEMYEKSLGKFKEAGRMDNYYLTLINVADCYNYIDEYDKSLETINESLEGLIPFGNSRLLAVAYGVKADVLKMKKEYGDARSAYEEAMANAYKISSNRTVQIAREFLELLITTEDFTRGDRLVKETQPFYDDANIEYQYSYLEVQADFEEAKNNYQSAVELLERAHILKDSSYQENKTQLVDDIQELYRVQEKERQNQKLTKTIVTKEENISLLTIGAFILIVVIVIVIVIWSVRTKYQKHIIDLEKERADDLSKKLSIEKENLQLKERLIEQQKTELLGYSMEVANMNEKIDNLIKDSEKTGNNHVGQQLKSLISVNKSWESFVSRFKEVEPNFIPKLSKAYPELTQKDLEFCSLVRINVSYKDIANFLQISHESVFKKRYRIAQKMGLEKGTDFQKFIIQFDG
tara:strand:- start:7084 stop:8910 length:1827 start_codon:yes stop_codon:yes gene_type:complete